MLYLAGIPAFPPDTYIINVTPPIGVIKANQILEVSGVLAMSSAIPGLFSDAGAILRMH